MLTSKHRCKPLLLKKIRRRTWYHHGERRAESLKTVPPASGGRQKTKGWDSPMSKVVTWSTIVCLESLFAFPSLWFLMLQRSRAPINRINEITHVDWDKFWGLVRCCQNLALARTSLSMIHHSNWRRGYCEINKPQDADWLSRNLSPKDLQKVNTNGDQSKHGSRLIRRHQHPILMRNWSCRPATTFFRSWQRHAWTMTFLRAWMTDAKEWQIISYPVLYLYAVRLCLDGRTRAADRRTSAQKWQL